MKYYSLINKTGLNGNYGQIAEGLVVEKQSKFISYLFKIDNEEDAQEYIEKLEKIIYLQDMLYIFIHILRITL